MGRRHNPFDFCGTLGIMDMWRAYRYKYKKHPEYGIDERTYKQICYAFNKAVSDYLVYEAGEINLFAGLGRLSIRKQRFTTPKVDHGSTRKLRNEGDKETVVYYIKPVRLRFHWNKSRVILENKQAYSFIPARYSALRKAHQALRDKKIDYFE